MDPITLALGLGGIGASLFGQNSTNRMQAEMMQQQMGFQQMMSNTAYQRASADMKAAGLNPMMMFSSGSAASTPPGASPSPMVKSGLDAESMQKMIGTAVQAKVANATIDNLVEQNAKIKAEAATERTRPALVVAQTGSERQRPALIRAQTGLTGAETASELQRPRLISAQTSESMTRRDVERHREPQERNRALTAINEEAVNPTARRIFDQGAYLGGRSSTILRPVTDVIGSARGVQRIFQDRFPTNAPSSWYDSIKHIDKYGNVQRTINRERIFNRD